MKILRVLRETLDMVIAEIHYAMPIFAMIFLIVLFAILSMAEHDYNRVCQRLNHLESRVNSIDPNIKDMTEIK